MSTSTLQVPASVPVFLEVLSGDKPPADVLGLVLAVLDYAQSLPGKEALLEEKKVTTTTSLLVGQMYVESPYSWRLFNPDSFVVISSGLSFFMHQLGHGIK